MAIDQSRLFLYKKIKSYFLVVIHVISLTFFLFSIKIILFVSFFIIFIRKKTHTEYRSSEQLSLKSKTLIAPRPELGYVII